MKLIALTVACLAMAGSMYAQDKPRVFITDSNSWEMRGAAGGSNGSFGASSAGGARPQTAEVIKTFGQRCPEVITNNRAELSDYIVELDHEGGKGLLAHKDKIAVFVRTSGDSIFSKSTLSVGGSVQDACEAIKSNWTQHSSELKAAAAAGSPAPQATTSATLDKATFVVSSNPAGADIEVDGGFVGSTPSTLELEPGEHQIAIKKKGFQAWTRKMKVTGGSLNINADLDPEATASKGN
jgi:hypothetical protein